MSLETDSYFTIGRQHVVAGKPCQDYALSGGDSEKKFAFAIISDGCSTGGNTDVGARLLTLATAEAVREYWEYDRVGSYETTISGMVPWVVRQRLLLSIEAGLVLGVQRSDMLATSIFALFTKYGGVVHVHGDGVVAVKYRNGSMEMFRFEWPQNMPFYSVYKHENLDAFIQAHGGDTHAEIVHQEGWNVDGEGCLTQHADVYLSMTQGIEGMQLMFHAEQEVEYVAIFSDGVTQIDNVDWKDAVRMFMNFKSTAGEFAKRRMIAGIKETMKDGKGPLDDISYAVIHITNDQKVGGES